MADIQVGLCAILSDEDVFGDPRRAHGGGNYHLFEPNRNRLKRWRV